MTITPMSISAAFLLSEAKGYRSRKSAIVTAPSGGLKSGQVLKAASRAAGSVAPFAGNTGNPTFSTITASGAAKPGLWGMVMTSATAFDVYDPDGNKQVAGAFGSAYSQGGLGFTATAGSTAAVAGDRFEINVDVNELTYTPYAGSGTVAGVLYNDIPGYGSSKDVQAVVLVRDCEVARFALIGLDGGAETALEALGIIVCGVYDN